MARKQIRVSDLSGETIDGNAAFVRIQIDSKPGSTFVLDAREDEVESLIASATEKRKRGRKAKN
jgi:hypothetical protein